MNAILPLTVVITFFAWLLIDPALFLAYLKTPIRSIMIILTILVIVISVIKYRGQALGFKCFKYVFPLLLLSSLIDMSNKLIMNYADDILYVAALHRVALTGWIIGFLNLFSNRKEEKILQIFHPKNLIQGSFIICLVISMVILNLAMYYTPNPAYCSAVFYLSVVWIILINKIQKWCGKKILYQNLDKKWIFSLLFATIVLVLVTN